MSVEYDYTKATVNSETLTFEIKTSSIEKTLESIKWVAPEALKIIFATALSTEEESTMDTIVSNHTGASLTEGSLLCAVCEEYTCGKSVGTPNACYVCGATGEDISDIYEHHAYLETLSEDNTLWKHYQKNDGTIRIAKWGDA